MMRKFPRIIAVVLAIAIIICPAINLTPIADAPANSYSLEYANDVITVTVTSTEGFIAALLRLEVVGYDVDESKVTVNTNPTLQDGASARPDFEGDVLSLLIAATTPADITPIKSATVTIPVSKAADAEKYYVALTEIQAAADGTVTDPVSFIEFEGVNEEGVLNSPLVKVDECAHKNITYTDNGDGTHDGKCDSDGATVVDNEAHVDADANNVCDKCPASVEPPVAECEHENALENRVVEFETDSIVYNTVCAECGDVISSETDSSDTAATVATSIATLESYSAVEALNGGTVTLNYELPTNKTVADIWLAYVDGTDIITGSKRDDSLKYNKITLVSYADGVLTVSVPENFNGVIVAYTIEDGSTIKEIFDGTGKTHALVLESNICYNLKINKTKLKIDGVEIFDSFYAIIDHEQYTPNKKNSETFIATTKVDATPYDELYDSDKEKYQVFKYAVSSMQLGDLIDCSYYGVRDGISYLIRVEENYSAVTYCTGSNGFDRGTDEVFKTLLADLLVYAAETQKYFLYNSENLITENDLVKAGVEKCRTKEDVDFTKYTTVPENTSIPNPADTSKNFITGTQALEMKDRIEVWLELNFANFRNQYGDATDELSFVLKYYNGANIETPIEYTFNDTFEYGKYDVIKCYEILPNKYDTRITLEIYHTDKETPIATRYYSVNTYLVKNATSDFRSTFDGGVKSETDLGTLCKAIAKYGDSSIKKFG